MVKQHCFRPLTGTLLSKQIRRTLTKKQEKRFRPLTGTLLSKHLSPFSLDNAFKSVFVPSRGLSYLNIILSCSFDTIF